MPACIQMWISSVCALCMNGNLEEATLCAGCCTLLFFWVHVSVWSHAFFPLFLHIAWHDDITMSLCTALLISLENECLALTNKADQLVFLMFMLYWICAHFQLGDTWGYVSGERLTYGPVFPGGVKVPFTCWFLWSSCSAPVLTLHMGCAFSLSGGTHRQNSLWDVFHVFDWCTGTVQIYRTGMISDACVHYVKYTLRFPCWFY